MPHKCWLDLRQAGYFLLIQAGYAIAKNDKELYYMACTSHRFRGSPRPVFANNIAGHTSVIFTHSMFGKETGSEVNKKTLTFEVFILFNFFSSDSTKFGDIIISL
jgi:hypothetical protein